MKRLSQPAANLSETANRQLHMYAVAASAAGVGILALAGPAEAKIVYTHADKRISPNHTIPLDLNHDGTIDFRFKDMHFTSPTYGFDHTGILSILPARQANRVEGYSRTNRHYASALQAGVSIGLKGPLKSGPRVMATVFSDTGGRRAVSNSCNGPWSKGANRFLGLEFLIKGKIHFGWARLSVTCRGTDVLATLTGYAYETVPDKPIIAGKTNGRDDATEELNPASLTVPTPQPASLGLLAMGTPGLSVWRREEVVGATQ